MKLVATQWISDQTPKGARFETDARTAHILVTGGLARPDDDEVKPFVAPDYLTAGMQAESASEPELAPTARSSYRRRDLKAEP